MSFDLIHVHLVLTLSFDRWILPLRPFSSSFKNFKTLPNISPFFLSHLSCHSKHVFNMYSQKSLLHWQALAFMLTTEFTNPLQLLCIITISPLCVCIYICICIYIDTHTHMRLLYVYIFLHLLYWFSDGNIQAETNSLRRLDSLKQSNWNQIIRNTNPSSNIRMFSFLYLLIHWLLH